MFGASGHAAPEERGQPAGRHRPVQPVDHWRRPVRRQHRHDDRHGHWRPGCEGRSGGGRHRHHLHVRRDRAPARQPCARTTRRPTSASTRAPTTRSSRPAPHRASTSRFHAPGPTETGQSIVCTFTNSAPRLVATKASSPVSTTPVAEGQLVTYTLTFDNSGGGQPATVNYTDNLTEVFDDASVVTPPALATGSGLTVSADQRRHVHRHRDARRSRTSHGHVRGAGERTGHRRSPARQLPGAHRHDTAGDLSCPRIPRARPTPSPPWWCRSRSAPASTTPVAEGQILTYTLTFSNTAGKAPATVNSHRRPLQSPRRRHRHDPTGARDRIPGWSCQSITGGKFTITGAVAAGDHGHRHVRGAG